MGLISPFERGRGIGKKTPPTRKKEKNMKDNFYTTETKTTIKKIDITLPFYVLIQDYNDNGEYTQYIKVTSTHISTITITPIGIELSNKRHLNSIPKSWLEDKSTEQEYKKALKETKKYFKKL